MHILENDVLKVSIADFGAELRSVIEKDSGHEFMWSGDAEHWNRVSPVLFPIVGRVYGGSYKVNGETYNLGQHGFLRDQVHTMISKDETSIHFSFESNEKTLKIYPFKHKVEISYKLEGRKVSVHWNVFNLDTKVMYYSIGAHPAFALTQGHEYAFELEGKSDVKMITLKDGHINGEIDSDTSSVQIEPKAFAEDAIIYTGLDSVSLVDKNSDHRVICSFPGFDYVGLWTKVEDNKLAPFICIEPWLGITDEVGGYEDISEKRSIKTLDVNESSDSVYSLEFK